MENLEKGCVYFFRHIGLTPIKIGYSENESPIKRFEQFKTYAPFGAELIGFIRTTRAKQLETALHQKYSRDRIKGEWFEITKEESEKCISFYSNLEDIEEMNSFQIAWANKLNINPAIHEVNEIFSNVFSLINCDIYKEKVILNKTEIIRKLNINKEELNILIKTIKLKYDNHSINGNKKKGFKLYTK